DNDGFRKCFKIADLGCSSGTNSLFVISHIIEQIEEICKEKNGSSHSPNEYQVFLNDLHGNEFNTLFNLLPNFYDTLNNDNNQSKKLCFISVLPGSFYGRLFPSNSLDFVHSSYSLTWLSQGVIKEADLHSFNLPIYTPSKEEVEGIVRSEGSFNLEKLERFLIPWDANDGNSNATTAEIVANFTRAFTEPIMAAQFGSSIMDEMYERFGHKLGELQSSTDAPPFSNMVISLCKK
ncbi:PREDICTED: caffeine synthase 1-like, partial [Erythranthe guttata]|uniref:caffeine synthase 1-like n=1 Tax=Erythranthe guttata TaxID=4155 RepID=UPI00064E1301